MTHTHIHTAPTIALHIQLQDKRVDESKTCDCSVIIDIRFFLCVGVGDSVKKKTQTSSILHTNM